jgi:Ala-tRNA(Pro) deacylase
MALVERVERYLVRNDVPYRLIPHREAFTAQEVAQSTHVAGRQLAKVVVIREGKSIYFMAVLPASCHVDFGVLRRNTGRQEMTLASEDEVRKLFPDCEAGAMPPFGNLYGLSMYLDHCFWEREEIFFQAGNHHEVVQMRFQDYLPLARPLAGSFCLHERLEPVEP